MSNRRERGGTGNSCQDVSLAVRAATAASTRMEVRRAPRRPQARAVVTLPPRLPLAEARLPEDSTSSLLRTTQSRPRSAALVRVAGRVRRAWGDEGFNGG